MNFGLSEKKEVSPDLSYAQELSECYSRLDSVTHKVRFFFIHELYIIYNMLSHSVFLFANIIFVSMYCTICIHLTIEQGGV